MMNRLHTLLAGEGLVARALRSSMYALGFYAIAQALRLASNFPDAAAVP